MRKLVILLCIVVLGAVFSSLALASVCSSYPNTQCAGAGNVKSGASGTLNLKLKIAGVAAAISQVSASVAVTSCETGTAVAEAASKALCSIANTTPGYTCTDLNAASICSPAAGVLLLTRCLDGSGNGITFSWSPGDVRFNVNPAGAGNPKSVLTNVVAGQDIGVDPQPNYIFEIADGAPGVLTFRITHACGGTNPITFTVDTTGKSSLQIAQAVADGFNTHNPSCTTLPASPHAIGEIANYSSMPAEHHCNYFTLVTRADTVSDITVVGNTGQLITVENGVSNPANSAPALNPWGAGALVAVLLATSLWFLRRRMRTA